ncbi:hypothetical protein TNCT_150091 [Trichonephila clavata]|uniref:Uncharacterized protein n=1 Tax=Trichonephila clavata TaxID=2740835 RepID=A0A8X6F623_TRICU|nr:hypothetical protein TNCT_150091 [Trichonephila clavata]
MRFWMLNLSINHWLKKTDIVDYSSDSSFEKSPSDEEMYDTSEVERMMERVIPMDPSMIIVGLETYRTWQYVDELKNPRREKSLSKPEHLTTERAQINEAKQEKLRINPIRLGPVRQEKSPSDLEQSPAMYQSKPEKSSTIPEKLCIRRKTPGVGVEHFGPEEFPSQLEQSAVKGRTGIPVDEQIGLEQSPMDGKTAIDAEASMQEKSPPNPEKSPIIRGRSRKSIEVSKQEKFPSEPEQSPVMRERSEMSTEASIQENSPSNLEKLHVTRGRPTMSIEVSRQESPSKPQQSPVRKGRARTYTNNLR